jgi:hypothetical protein
MSMQKYPVAPIATEQEIAATCELLRKQGVVGLRYTLSDGRVCEFKGGPFDSVAVYEGAMEEVRDRGR